MNFSDYLLDTVLVLLVVRQIRESRWDRRAVLLPLGITAWVASSYLTTMPTSRNDIALVAGLTAVGVLFGAVSAAFTRVRSDGGSVALVKAGWIAAGVWILSMGSRFAFAVWASNGGGPALYRFSGTHHLAVDTWTTALVLMALGEVITRVGLLTYRAYRAHQARRAQTVPVAAEQLVTL